MTPPEPTTVKGALELLLRDFDEARTYAHRTVNDAADVTRADLEYLAGTCGKLYGVMLVLLARMQWQEKPP